MVVTWGPFLTAVFPASRLPTAKDTRKIYKGPTDFKVDLSERQTCILNALHEGERHFAMWEKIYVFVETWDITPPAPYFTIANIVVFLTVFKTVFLLI